jgi:hypothetical protein
MKKELKESIKFLLNEYKRLDLKEKKQKITKDEKETLERLKSFMGKKENE